ncbi:S-adenosyl-L-methionine-dependent methyltransferase [Hyaloraphidium curvatum]|nr:S-adenosyl-L-methionine-dependent methyltransferase [Hyaloraphidium curvatum]
MVAAESFALRKAGRRPLKDKLFCATLSFVALAMGLTFWSTHGPSDPQPNGSPGLHSTASPVPGSRTISHGPGASSSLSIAPSSDFRVFAKPDRLCLGPPYNACVDVATTPESLYGELLKTCPSSGCTVLDIGANRGDFIETTLKIAPQTKIVSFEPHPLLAQELERRFGHADNVVLHKAGLSIAPGTLHAAVSVGRGYQSVKFIKSCSEITQLHRERYNKTCQQIPTIALDDVINAPVNIMKVDVQGHELDVLLGGISSFVQRGYDIILSELSPSLFESEAHARLYLKLLASLGYRIYPLQQMSPQFRKTAVELPAEGADISTWPAIASMRLSGSWMDLLCVKAGLERRP